MKVEIKNLYKSFKSHQVLNGINVNIHSGKVTAIMGPNGSGKSTLIKSILGLVIPDKGEINFNDKNIIGKWDYRKEIGYMPQTVSYPDNITVSELLKMIADIRKETPDFSYLLSLFDMGKFTGKKMKELSGGMRQKVNLILSLMFHTKLLIFDEPTVGLDPVSRIKFKECILKEKQNGKTILLTTHYTAEIEELADNLVFLLDGKIFFEGPVELLKQEQKEQNLERATAKILELKSQCHE